MTRGGEGAIEGCGVRHGSASGSDGDPSTALRSAQDDNEEGCAALKMTMGRGALVRDAARDTGAHLVRMEIRSTAAFDFTALRSGRLRRLQRAAPRGRWWGKPHPTTFQTTCGEGCGDGELAVAACFLQARVARAARASRVARARAMAGPAEKSW